MIKEMIMHSKKNFNFMMIKLMSGVIMPVLILLIISAVLAKLVKKRSQESENRTE